jgi:hypothetical protein
MKKIRHIILSAALLGTIAGPSAAAAGENEPDSWQLKQLHTPSTALRKAEQRGRVTIYEGLQVAEVDRALDGQFERIENMMFVRTKHPTPEGEVVVEDDGC